MSNMVRRVSLCFAVAAVVSCFPGCSPEQKKAKHLKQGEAFLAESKTREAIIEFRNILQIDPKDAFAYYKLGLAYLMAGQVKEAYADLSRSVELKRDNVDAHLKLAGILLAGREPSRLVSGWRSRWAWSRATWTHTC